jgi:GNAT superfamily N-acetyltransferase
MESNDKTDRIKRAIEVFLHGFSRSKSQTWPCEFSRVGPLWWLRDAPRKRAAEYRKEEWIAFGVTPQVAHETALRGTRGRYCIGSISGSRRSEELLKCGYRELGYRLLATEPLFVHKLSRVPRVKAPALIELMRTQEHANLLARATRRRPAPPAMLADPSFRQYLAFCGPHLTGWVRSIATPAGNWCSSMYVLPTHRRQGIGKALLAKMLRDDRQRGAGQSVLLSSHSGALLYPGVGYEQLGTLSIFVPPRSRQVQRSG